MISRLDHIAIVAPTLDAGAAVVEARLGVKLQPGGQHVRMGTHNRLLRLGEALYLEIIAVDPSLPRPDRPRWFDMDKNRATRLAAWVARTDTIEAAPDELGEVLPMARGDLNWRITVPADGHLPLGGAAPVLIQWASADHPAGRMADAGCGLDRLELIHPAPAQVRRILDAIGFQGPVTVSTGPMAAVVAHIRTPKGVVRL